LQLRQTEIFVKITYYLHTSFSAFTAGFGEEGAEGGVFVLEGAGSGVFVLEGTEGGVLVLEGADSAGFAEKAFF